MIVAALARDQASILDAAEAVFHIPGSLTLPAGQAVYEGEVEVAESVAFRLGRAIEKYRMELDGGWEGRLKSAGSNKNELRYKLQSTASGHYWTQVEKHLSLLLEHVQAMGSSQNDFTRAAWRSMLAAAAREAYCSACGQETPRHKKAFSRGWMIVAANRSNNSDTNQPARKESDL